MSFDDEIDDIVNETESSAKAQADEKEIERLAKLGPLQYARERAAAAKRLGVIVGILDKAVKAARAPEQGGGQGRAFEAPDIEPWEEPVDGADLLDEISGAILRYVVMPTESADTLALWAVHTHCFECFWITPRAAITSPEKQCGKTTTLDVLECLVARPLPTSNATASSIFRVVEMAKPTLLIDEADTFLKDDEKLRGILNTGYRRGGSVLRNVGDDHQPSLFSTWAPAAIAAIGNLTDTINDRSVGIRLRRRKSSEKITSFRKKHTQHLTELARKAARWAEDHETELAAADPDMEELFNRMADNWEPLFAIAEAAGGRWSKRVREIARIAVAAANDESTAALLFTHIKWIFNGCPEKGEDGEQTPAFEPTDRLSSEQIVERLIKIEGAPWAEWGRDRRPITKNRLATLLGRFEILSGNIRLPSGKTPKGYYLTAFADAFARYLPPDPSAPPFQNATSPQPNNDGHFSHFQNATDENGVAFQKSQKLNNGGHCGDVAFQNPPERESEGFDSDDAPPTAPDPVQNGHASAPISDAQDGNGHWHEGAERKRAANGHERPGRACAHCKLPFAAGEAPVLTAGRDGYKVVVHRECEEALRAPVAEADPVATGRGVDEDDLAIPQFLRRDA